MTIGIELDEKVFIQQLTNVILTHLEIEDDRERRDKLKNCLTELFKNYVVYSYHDYEDL